MGVLLRSTDVFQGHRASVYALCKAGEGAFLSAGGDGVVVRWELNRPEEGRAVAMVGEPVYSMALDAHRQALLIGCGSGRLLVIDLESGVEAQVEHVHQKGIFRIVPLGNGLLACAGGDGVLSVWQWAGEGMARLVQQRSIALCAEKLRDITLLNEGRLAVACGDGMVRILDTGSFNGMAQAEGHSGGAYGVCMHPTKPVLLTGGKDGALKAWREDGSPLHAVPAHKGSVYVVSVDPHGRFLYTAGRDALVKVWDLATLDPVARSQRDRSGHTHSVNAAIWCGEQLITASDDRRIRSWSMPSMR